MFIQEKGIALRALEPADADLLFKWENDRDIWEVSETLVPFSMFQIEQFILDAGDIYASRQLRMMVDKVSDEGKTSTIGTIDLYDFDPRNSRAGIGVYISPAFRKQGKGHTALALCIKYAFETLSLHQLYCFIAENNSQSINLFEKSGFVRTGIHKDWLLVQNRFIDQFHYQLLNPNQS